MNLKIELTLCMLGFVFQNCCLFIFFFNVASNICKVSVFGLCFVLRLTVLSSFAIISLRIKSAMLFLAVV